MPKNVKEDPSLLEGLKPVMKVVGSMREAGLGPLRWWKGEDEEQEDNMSE
jgi:DNA-directed RNA polymerase subunit E'/Rpb7